MPKKKPGWGGRRPNQSGRPSNPSARQIRVGTLFLPPDDAARLALRAEDGEMLIETAKRLLIADLSKGAS